MNRQARQSRPQLVCVLADDSNSMRGEKAQAATDGIRDMLMECQTKGPKGLDRSYYQFLLIRFDGEARVDPKCDMTPVRRIDSTEIVLEGTGGMTNITAAIQLTLDRLRPYMQTLQDHSERAEHPLPLVLLFSDGQHNSKTAQAPHELAAELKRLNIDGEPVLVACAGVSLGNKDSVDEEMLRDIASPECYVSIENCSQLTAFLSAVGSSGASRAKDIARIITEQVQE